MRNQRWSYAPEQVRCSIGARDGEGGDGDGIGPGAGRELQQHEQEDDSERTHV